MHLKILATFTVDQVATKTGYSFLQLSILQTATFYIVNAPKSRQ